MMEDEPWWHEPQSGEGPPLAGNPASAEEAARLMAAFRDRILNDPAALRAGIQMLDLLKTWGGNAANPVPPGHAPECAYCPVCQAISRAQNLNPETLDVVTSAALQFAETLKQALSDPGPAKSDTVRNVPLDDEF
jgi:hypothetical protein